MSLYGKTREKLYDKEMEALEKIDKATFRRKFPTVAEYCEKWLMMQSAHVRATTLTDYTSKVQCHIISELGDKCMADVTLDDIQVTLVPVSKKSESVYKSVIILYKSIFRAAEESRLLDAIQGLPPYVFVMLGLYAGLRREEKANSTSEYVVANRDGDPLSYTQFRQLWKYVVTRTTKERAYYRYKEGVRVKHTIKPVLGEKAAHSGKVVYSPDFEVTPELRHTYFTNLIHASVDPKTVQYLAGHESSKITMDIYAKVKYNKPDELVRTMSSAFAQCDAEAI